MLQREAGYIDARPTSDRSAKSSCNARAGPYIRVNHAVLHIFPCRFSIRSRRENRPSNAQHRAQEGLAVWALCPGSRLGSDADLLGTDKSGLKQVDFPAVVHLASHEFEACDLTFGLSVRPGQSNCCSDSRFVLGDAAGKRSNEAAAGAFDPRCQSGYGFAPDHHMEVGDDLASLDKRGDAGFDGSDSDSFGLRQHIPSDCHEAGDCSGRRNPLKGFGVDLFSPSSACRPFAYDT
jgi:hypothetical protein